MDAWVSDLDSWDVCDAVCGNLFDRTPFALDKAVGWTERQPEFERRAGFVLMACAAVHRKDLADTAFAGLLPTNREASTDDRTYVKKAVSWALRQIGKRSLGLNAKAIRTAEQMGGTMPAHLGGSRAMRSASPQRRRAGAASAAVT